MLGSCLLESVESAPGAVFQEMQGPVRVPRNWQPLIQGKSETLHRAADRAVLASGQLLFRSVHLARASPPGLVGVIPSSSGVACHQRGEEMGRALDQGKCAAASNTSFTHCQEAHGL